MAAKNISVHAILNAVDALLENPSDVSKFTFTNGVKTMKNIDIAHAHMQMILSQTSVKVGEKFADANDLFDFLADVYDWNPPVVSKEKEKMLNQVEDILSSLKIDPANTNRADRRVMVEKFEKLLHRNYKIETELAMQSFARLKTADAIADRILEELEPAK